MEVQPARRMDIASVSVLSQPAGRTRRGMDRSL